MLADTSLLLRLYWKIDRRADSGTRRSSQVIAILGFVIGVIISGVVGGFAGALQEIGLPQHAIPVALAFFNIGVELGQLLFIAVVFGFLAGLRVLAPAPAAPPGTWDVAERLSVPAAYVVGTVAMFWVFERTLGFWV